MGRCGQCGSETGVVLAGNVSRCVECGRILPKGTGSGPAVSQSAPGRHTYTTPYGKLVAQLQPTGVWAAVVQPKVPAGRERAAALLLRNLMLAYEKIEHPSLPKLYSFDDAKLRWTWLLPKAAGMAALAASPAPHSPERVRALVMGLAQGLDELHAAGLGACDLSPSVVFTVPRMSTAIIIPTPWLPNLLHWAPGRSGEMPFVASELGGTEQESCDVTRADLFALGALAWYCLTGNPRSGGAAALPDHQPDSMPGWDAFIDGCCRTRPERRFESIGAALNLLEQRSSPGVAASTPATDSDGLEQAATSARNPPGPPTSATPVVKRRGWRALTLTALVFALVVGLVLSPRKWLIRLLPGAEHVLVKYQRGFGDTILRYEDRSYEGAAWKRMQDLAGLKAGGLELVQLTGVTGWDSESFSIVATTSNGMLAADGAAVVPYDGGHWGAPTRLPRSGNWSTQRTIDRNTVLVAIGRSGACTLYRIDGLGSSSFGRVKPIEGQEICPIAADLFYYFEDYGWGGLAVKVAGDRRIDMPVDKYKEALVHRQDNRPLSEYPVCFLKLTRSYEGRAVGIWHQNGKKLVARYRDGIWYADITFGGPDLEDLWLVIGGEDQETLIGVGGEGHVRRITERGMTEQTVPPGGESTSLRLIKVWGVSLDRYWTMNEDGTVWEWSSGHWRVVVRGLHRNGIAFVAAWVSPEGVVIAVTKDSVYRLE